MSLSLATVAKMLELIGEVERLTAKLAECRAVLNEHQYGDCEYPNADDVLEWFCSHCGTHGMEHDPSCAWLRAMTDEEPKQ